MISSSQVYVIVVGPRKKYMNYNSWGFNGKGIISILILWLITCLVYVASCCLRYHNTSIDIYICVSTYILTIKPYILPWLWYPFLFTINREYSWSSNYAHNLFQSQTTKEHKLFSSKTKLHQKWSWILIFLFHLILILQISG